MSLANNQITAVDENLFTSNGGLTNLVLTANLLSDLPNNLLQNNRILYQIELGANNFTTVPSTVLSLSSLRKLNMIDNQIIALGNQAENFAAQYLAYLDFSFNPLSVAGIDQSNWFSNQTELIEFTCIACNLNGIPSSLSTFKNLRILKLDKNAGITSLGQDALASISLQQLSLSQCSISTPGLDFNAFESLPQIQDIRLEANNLTTPYVRYFENLPKLKSVEWDNNPWICDCHAIPFSWVLRNSYQANLKKLLKRTVVCESPAEVQGQYIDELEEHTLDQYGTCTIPTPPPIPDFVCPDSCTCPNNITLNCNNVGLNQLPVIPYGINYVNFDNNNITSINKNAFIYVFQTLSSFSIQNNKIATLQTGLFKDFTRLHKIILDANPVSAFYSNTWPTSVRYLSCNDCQINAVSAEQGFSNLNQLTSLYLKNNVLTDFTSPGLENLVILNILDLSGNRLINLPNLDPSIQFLSQLYLDSNELVALNEYTGPTQNGLQTLSAADNKIQAIGNDFFYAFPNVVTLSLNNNQIASLPATLGLNSLNSLDLSTNNLNTVNDTVFDGNTNLQTLILDHNQFKTIPVGVLQATRSLKNINFSNNLLQDLGQTAAVSNAQFLSVLDLSFNELNEASLENTWLTASTTPKLSVLNLSKNEFKSVPNVSDLANSLTQLMLDKNSQITRINAGDISNLKNLQQFSCQSCLINDMDDLAFQGLSKLNSFNLDNNALETPRALWFDGLFSLEMVIWSANPWVCDCQSLPFDFILKGYNETALNIRSALTNTVLCYENFNGQYIDDVNAQDLASEGNCDFTTPANPTVTPNDCPDSCECFDNNQIVNCEGRNLEAIPPLPYNVVELNFNRNILKTLEPAVFSNLPFLRIIRLVENQLTTIPSNAFSGTSATEISLQRNSISQTDFTTAFPPTLLKLQLQKNQISGNVQ